MKWNAMRIMEIMSWWLSVPPTMQSIIMINKYWRTCGFSSRLWEIYGTKDREKKKKKEFDNLYACNKLKQENTTNNKVKKIINKNNDDIGLKEIIRKEVKLVLATKTDV